MIAPRSLRLLPLLLIGLVGCSAPPHALEVPPQPGPDLVETMAVLDQLVDEGELDALICWVNYARVYAGAGLPEGAVHGWYSWSWRADGCLHEYRSRIGGRPRVKGTLPIPVDTILHPSVTPEAIASKLRPRLLRWGQDLTRPERVRFAALYLAGELPGGEEVARRLTRAALGDPSHVVRGLALERLLDTSRWERSPRAARWAGSMRAELARVLRADGSPRQRSRAAQALGFAPGGWRALALAMTDGDREVRATVAEALGEHGAPAVPALVALTYDSSRYVRAHACYGLERVGSAADPLARARLLQLAKARRRVGEAAVNALRSVVPPAERWSVLRGVVARPELSPPHDGARWR